MKHAWMILVAVMVCVLVGCSSPAPRVAGSDGVYDDDEGTLTNVGSPSLRSHGSAPREEGFHDAADREYGKTVTTTSSPATKQALSRFYGVTVRGAHVVYVVDCSATTARHWSAIRTELITSVGDLWLDQDFSVIVMGVKKPLQTPLKDSLIHARKHNQARTAAFLLQLEPTGKTNPAAALDQAFKTLDTAGGGDCVVYFLTDSATLPQALPAQLAKLNKGRGATVVTYLIGPGSRDSQRVLQAMADGNGGTFKQVKAADRSLTN